MRDTEAALRQRTSSKNIFIRILEALHASRRREAQRMICRYGHLIERHSPAMSGILPDISHMKEGDLDADRSKSSIGARGQARLHSANGAVRGHYV